MMRFERSVHKNCPHCRGTGYVWTEVVIEGGFSTSFDDCSCVEYFVDEEMKATIRAAVELANPTPQGVTKEG